MSKEQDTQYKYRALARFVIEAETPLAVGSGQKDLLTDAMVAVDVNGLPYIPGTSLAGVVRSLVGANKNEPDYFGFQKGDKGHGSEIIISEARMLDSKGKVADGMIDPILLQEDDLLREYARLLPIRQHVCITGKGVAKKGGKFDRQVVYAGTRFCFEIELLSKNKQREEEFLDVIQAVSCQTFRIGGGIHNGFGQIKVIEVKTAKLDLSDKNDLNLYLDKSSSMAQDELWPGWQVETSKISTDENYEQFHFLLQAEDFFLFGSGFGDEKGDADITPVKASRVEWHHTETGWSGVLKRDLLLIPATSVKGALRHRVAYRYNQFRGQFVDGSADKIPQEADKNPAVLDIFGGENENGQLQAGRLLMSDIIVEPMSEDKLMNHVSIDRLTGGAIDGALFAEQVTYASGMSFVFDIFVHQDAFKRDKVKEAFEKALDDLKQGLLPLGGGVNRGHGLFHEVKK